MTKVDEAIVEIEAALAAMAPEHEGLRDFARLNLEPATLATVQSFTAAYDKRFAALTAALTKCRLLIEDGYPELALREIADSEFKDLQANAATIEAALAKFGSSKAVTLGLGGNVVEDK